MKEKKAITLIALVVTIVVMLILAGVSLRLVLNENGLITKSSGVKKLSECIFMNCSNLARIKFLPTDMTGIDIDKSIFNGIENCTIYVKNEIVKNYMEQKLSIPTTVKIEILK